jgi:hypothetical protein
MDMSSGQLQKSLGKANERTIKMEKVSSKGERATCLASLRDRAVTCLHSSE